MLMSVPNYLKDYSDVWQRDPHQANLEWFKNAKFGMFIHYGLYSQLEKAEWVQFHDRIHVAEYEKLASTFNPDKFDADYITDLACEAEMKYINLTTCHHDSFCLWNCKTEKFNSYNTCKRDLVRELAQACDKKGLGFFSYYTYMLNWRHPYFLNNDYFHLARPHFETPETAYKFKEISDFRYYVDYIHSCIEELLDMDYPMAGIWFDIISIYYLHPDIVPVKETYEIIRRKRPDLLLAYKQGATGEEDFASPEREGCSQGELLRKQGFIEAGDLADRAWAKNVNNPRNEICACLQERGWAYQKDVLHHNVDGVLSYLSYAESKNCNLLLNTGLLPDGSVHPADVKVLKETGNHIRQYGWPTEELVAPKVAKFVQHGQAE